MDALSRKRDSPEEYHKAKKESVPILFLSRTGQVSFSISQSQALSKA